MDCGLNMAHCSPVSDEKRRDEDEMGGAAGYFSLIVSPGCVHVRVRLVVMPCLTRLSAVWIGSAALPGVVVGMD